MVVLKRDTPRRADVSLFAFFMVRDEGEGIARRFAPLARFLPETTAKIHIVLGEFKESLKVIERASGAQSARDVVAGSEDLEPPANWEAWYKVQATYGSGDLEQASSLLDGARVLEARWSLARPEWRLCALVETRKCRSRCINPSAESVDFRLADVVFDVEYRKARRFGGQC